MGLKKKKALLKGRGCCFTNPKQPRRQGGKGEAKVADTETERRASNKLGITCPAQAQQIIKSKYESKFLKKPKISM